MELFAHILGYAGMALVVLSFVFKNVKLIRIVNIIGNIFSASFAFMLLFLTKHVSDFLPTAILSFSLIVVNIVMLIEDKIKAKKKE